MPRHEDIELALERWAGEYNAWYERAHTAKATNEEWEKIRSWEKWLQAHSDAPGVKALLKKRRARDAKA